jgi:hypothetical protein
MYCRKCGSMLGASDKFCAICGSPSSASNAEKPFLIPLRDGQQPKGGIKKLFRADILVLAILLIICFILFINGQPLVKMFFSTGVVLVGLNVTILCTLLFVWKSRIGGMKSLYRALIFAIPVVGMCIYFLIPLLKPKYPVQNKSAVSASSNSDDVTSDVSLMAMASSINKGLPMMVGSGIRMDSTYGSHKTFGYIYTLTNFTSQTFNEADLQRSLGGETLNKTCTTKELRAYIDGGVTFIFSYYGSDGKQIGTIRIEPSQCT